MSADAAKLRFMLDKNRAATLAAVLDWYREMGAEETVGEIPVDWLQRGDLAPGHGFSQLSTHPAAAPQPKASAAAPPAARRPEPAPRAPAPRQFPTTAPDAAVMAARAAAREAATLDELQTRLAGFDGCSLKATAKNLCF